MFLLLAMYEAVAVVYIAQRMGIVLDFHDIILIGITAMLASMAAASMPSAGLFTMAMVLTSVGLPSDKLAVIVPIDWFLDRFRTMTNVFSDAVGTAIVSKLCEKQLTEGMLDTIVIPEVKDQIQEFPGGLTEVELKKNVCDAENGNASSPPPTVIVDGPAYTNHSMPCYMSTNSYKRTVDGAFRSCTLANSVSGFSLSPTAALNPGHNTNCNSSAASVYIVDEETIVLKF